MSLLQPRATLPPPDSCTPGSDLDCDTRAWKNLAILLVTLAVVLYVVGVLFSFSSIRTRVYNRQAGTTWVPPSSRTETCCVCFERIRRYWTALLWPLFGIIICIYYVYVKALSAAARFGQARQRKQQRKRQQAANRNIHDVDIEPGSVPEPVRSSSSVISMPPVLTPPPIYEAKRKSVASRVSLLAQGANTPLPHYQSRQNSVSSLGDSVIMHLASSSRDRSETGQAVGRGAAENS